ncbi:Uncharacterised protein [uncultured archaeon]|nr:Uncharacterised protein [uncultured archaeon]
MILNLKETLEARVEDEVKSAIEALIDNEQEASPIIEQQTDTDSYESTTYNIDVGYDGKSTKGYYETLTAESDTVGASITALYSEKEHEALKEGQEVATKAHETDNSRGFFVEAVIDCNVRDAKNNIKLFSPALWQAMYNGGLVFN